MGLKLKATLSIVGIASICFLYGYCHEGPSLFIDSYAVGCAAIAFGVTAMFIIGFLYLMWKGEESCDRDNVKALAVMLGTTLSLISLLVGRDFALEREERRYRPIANTVLPLADFNGEVLELTGTPYNRPPVGDVARDPSAPIARWNAEERAFRQSDVEHLKIDGGALLWDLNQEALYHAHYKLSRENRASYEDEKIAVCLIREEKRKAGSYTLQRFGKSASGGILSTAYSTTLDIVITEYPSRRVLARVLLTIPPEDSPEGITHPEQGVDADEDQRRKHVGREVNRLIGYMH